jgi:hypothetical protein
MRSSCTYRGSRSSRPRDGRVLVPVSDRAQACELVCDLVCSVMEESPSESFCFFRLVICMEMVMEEEGCTVFQKGNDPEIGIRNLFSELHPPHKPSLPGTCQLFLALPYDRSYLGTKVPMIPSLQPKRPKGGPTPQQSRQTNVTEVVDGRASSMPRQQVRHESNMTNGEKYGRAGGASDALDQGTASKDG